MFSSTICGCAEMFFSFSSTTTGSRNSKTGVGAVDADVEAERRRRVDARLLEAVVVEPGGVTHADEPRRARAA